MEKMSGLKKFALLNLGTFLVTIGVYFFKFPNNFSTGGVTGIAVVMGPLTPNISPGTYNMAINVVLLLIGCIFLGKRFVVMTLYSSMTMAVAITLLERYYPMSGPFTNQPMLELIFAVMLPAVGCAILFNIDASNGGTDIIAMLMKKYTSMDIGRGLFISDFFITIATFFVFDVQTGLFSLTGLMAKSLVVDSVLENFNLCKYFTIITTKPEEICDFISTALNRGATTYDASGAFTHEHKTIVITVLRRNQAILLQKYIKRVDPHAFIMITNTSEIIGKGFRETA